MTRRSPVVVFVLSGNRNYAPLPLVNAVEVVAPVFIYLASVTLRPSESSAEDLRESLHKAGLKPPFILAGHSFGGMTAICYCNRWPTEVAGLLLMDSTHPLQTPTALEALPPEGAASSPAVEEFRRSIQGKAFGPEFVSIYEESCRQVNAIKDLGNVPLVVLTAGKPDMPAEIESGLREKLTRDFHNLQADYARRSTVGELRIVPGVGHDLGEFRFVSDPDQNREGSASAVTQAIAELVERFRAKETVLL